MTHPDVVCVYDDHPVIRLESQLLEVGIDRAQTPASIPDDATMLHLVVDRRQDPRVRE